MPCLSGGVKRWLTGEPFGDWRGGEEIRSCVSLTCNRYCGHCRWPLACFFLFTVMCKEKLYQVSFSPDQGICGHFLGSKASSPSG